MTEDVVIDAKEVFKVYDTGTVKVEALRGLSLSVAEGEMVSIMGPSGCGKTTLLNCLSGLDDITSGRVFVESKDISKMSDNEKTDHRAQRMGFIFQAFNLLPVLTAAENVELPLIVGGMGQKEARAKAIEALRLVDMENWKDQKPSELSGGQQQRVTIARSLVNDPAIIWADEPTGNLDTENSKQVMEILCRLSKEKKKTILVVTHDSTIGNMADRVVMMRNGIIEKTYTPTIH